MLYKALLLSAVILFSTFATYRADAAPAIEILDTYGYLNEFGEYVVLGEVQNTGDTPARFVEIIVTFFDENGEQLQQVPVSTSLEILHPGQVSPFQLTLKDTQDSLSVTSYHTTIGNFAPATSKEIKLSIIFHKLETSDDSVIVSGRLVNDGSSNSDNTKVTIILYNLVGEPIRFASTFTDPKDILPFGSALFSARIKVDDPTKVAGYAISSESSKYGEVSRLVQKQQVPLERIQEVVRISDLSTMDSNNRAANSVREGEPVLVRVDIDNMLSESREYTYILQVLDEEGFVSSISWSTGVLRADGRSTPTIAWVPTEEGTYRLEVYIWKSIEEAVPLSFRTLSTSVRVS